MKFIIEFDDDLDIPIQLGAVEDYCREMKLFNKGVIKSGVELINPIHFYNRFVQVICEVKPDVVFFKTYKPK